MDIKFLTIKQWALFISRSFGDESKLDHETHGQWTLIQELLHQIELTEKGLTKPEDWI